MAEPLVLINAFEVPAADAERFIAGWRKIRDYLMSQPGQTAQDFLAATQSPGFREVGTGLTDFRPHPGLYRVVPT
jgi:hypothetical protein